MTQTLALPLFAALALLAPLSHLNAAEHIKHVFVIVLENEAYSTTFGHPHNKGLAAVSLS